MKTDFLSQLLKTLIQLSNQSLLRSADHRPCRSCGSQQRSYGSQTEGHHAHTFTDLTCSLFPFLTSALYSSSLQNMKCRLQQQNWTAYHRSTDKHKLLRILARFQIYIWSHYYLAASICTTAASLPSDYRGTGLPTFPHQS